MSFFRDCRVSSVLESSCTTRTLRFSARCFLALIAMNGMYVCFAGAKKQTAKKPLSLETPISIFLETPLQYISNRA
jgi:hypothetical protein